MRKNIKLQLGASLWVLAMNGVIIVILTMLPQLLAKAPQRVPLSVALTASILQSAVMLAAAVWVGVSLSKPLGLGAPVFEAALTKSNLWPMLRSQLGPAVLVGVVVGALLGIFPFVAPTELVSVGQTVNISLAAKVFYGGVTEEVLMRWGLMTVLIWLPWRICQKKIGGPRRAYVVSSVLLTAVLFGIGHLPVVTTMGIKLTAPVIAFIIAGNALPGILFGVLYWRNGIEAAMIAHALGHVVANLVAGV